MKPGIAAVLGVIFSLLVYVFARPFFALVFAGAGIAYFTAQLLLMLASL